MNAQQKKEPDEPLRIPLDFEETLADLMKIKPVENDNLRKSPRKEKSESKKTRSKS